MMKTTWQQEENYLLETHHCALPASTSYPSQHHLLQLQQNHNNKSAKALTSEQRSF